MSPAAPDSLPDKPVGGRYRVEGLLGRGAQGSTYAAFDEQLQRRVAIKAFAFGRAGEWKQFDLFKRECAVLQTLQHPQIPRYLEELESEDGATCYLVMEHIAGVTLRQKAAEQGAFSEAALWQVLWQVAGALSYLHGRSPPVVHRDIKPANLIERPSGEIVLVDFGGVRNALRPDGGSTIVGTFGYMAPEQLHGQATPATDLFSLGATLIALGTGLEPEALPRKGLHIDFEAHLQVSPELARLLRSLTEPEPERRPSSGPKLRQELEAISQGRPAAPGQDFEIPQLPDDVPPQLGVAAGILMALVGTVGGVALTVLEAVVLPLVFSLIAAFAGGDRRRLLQAKEREVRRALKAATPQLRQLSRHGYDEFEAHRRRLPGPPQRRLKGRGRNQAR